LTGALVVVLTVPVALGLMLAKRGRRAALASPRERDAMYRTAFGFSLAAGTDEVAGPVTAPARRPMALVASMLPFVASGLYVAVSPHHAKQIWLFSCRLFGH